MANSEGINWKPTNPKDVVGVRKVPFSCLPCGPLAEAAIGMQEGAMKYGRHNYRDEGVLASTYYDAVYRHMMDWWEGEDIDPGSGLAHVTKAITSLLVLRDAQMNGKCVDDRPIRMTNKNWLEDLNQRSSALVDKYTNPKMPYLHKPVAVLKKKENHLAVDKSLHNMWEDLIDRDTEVFPVDKDDAGR